MGPNRGQRRGQPAVPDAQQPTQRLEQLLHRRQTIPSGPLALTIDNLNGGSRLPRVCGSSAKRFWGANHNSEQVVLVGGQTLSGVGD
jgi:hypothetical protein